MNEYKNILVAVDDSKEAQNALRKAIEIAKINRGSILHIANVIDSYSIPEDDFKALQREKIKSENMLREYKLIATELGLSEVEILIKDGNPKTLITEELAPLVKANLIVCGVQSIKNAEHFFLGSVSEKVVQDALCDVMIVRTD